MHWLHSPGNLMLTSLILVGNLALSNSRNTRSFQKFLLHSDNGTALIRLNISWKPYRFEFGQKLCLREFSVINTFDPGLCIALHFPCILLVKCQVSIMVPNHC